MANRTNTKHHVEYDDQHRVVLEVVNDATFSNTVRYSYEHEWISREEEHRSADGSVHYHTYDRERSDGSEWTQKIVDHTEHTVSEMRMFVQSDGNVIWHNTEIDHNGKITRECFLNRTRPEGIAEIAFRDGRLTSYDIHKPTIWNDLENTTEE